MHRPLLLLLLASCYADDRSLRGVPLFVQDAEARGGSRFRTTPSTPNRKPSFTHECGVCEQDEPCGGEGTVLICHKGRTTCIPSASYSNHCHKHGDTCGACEDDLACHGDAVCTEQGSCTEEGTIEICHKGRTQCINETSWLSHCYNHGDTCGSCSDDLVCLDTVCDAMGGCTEEGTIEVCHKGRTTCIESHSWLGHCSNHGDTCGACEDSAECEADPCTNAGSCTEEGTIEICHNGRTRCVEADSWVAHCRNHGDTCGACSAEAANTNGNGGGNRPENAGPPDDVPVANGNGGGNRPESAGPPDNVPAGNAFGQSSVNSRGNQ